MTTAVAVAKNVLSNQGCFYTEDETAERMAEARGLQSVQVVVADQLGCTVESVTDELNRRHFNPVNALQWWDKEVKRMPCPIVVRRDETAHSRRFRAAMNRLFAGIARQAFGKHHGLKDKT